MTLLNRKTTPANAWPGLIRHAASADTLKVMDSGRWRAPTAHGPVRATLRLPGSKSISNRALILAALSDSPSVVRGVLKARDTSLAVGALSALGCVIHSRGTDVGVHPGSPGQGAAVSVDVGNAGTVMRFLPAVAALTPAAVAFDGDPRARERPVGAHGVTRSGEFLEEFKPLSG